MFSSVTFEEVFPKGRTPSPFHLHRSGSFVLIEQLPRSVFSSEFSRGALNAVVVRDDDPRHNMGHLFVRDCITVPPGVGPVEGVSAGYAERLSKLLSPRSPWEGGSFVPQPVLWYPGIDDKVLTVQPFDDIDWSKPQPTEDPVWEAPESDVVTRAILSVAVRHGLKEVPVYRPIRSDEVDQLRKEGLEQMVGFNDVGALCTENHRGQGRDWLEAVMPAHMVAGNDPRHDFLRMMLSSCFTQAIYSRCWEAVHAVLDFHEHAGGVGLPLHAQDSRHASLGKILRFVGMTASGNDRVDIVSRLHDRLKPLGLETEELFFKGLAAYGHKDPELDQTFARQAPSVRAWLSSQASLKAIQKVTKPHEAQARVPRMGPRP